jgi:hypothetical protein
LKTLPLPSGVRLVSTDSHSQIEQGCVASHVIGLPGPLWVDSVPLPTRNVKSTKVLGGVFPAAFTVRRLSSWRLGSSGALPWNGFDRQSPDDGFI